MTSRATLWYRVGVRLAVLALVAHALLAAFHMPVLAWSAGTGDGLTRGVIICTANGVKIVALDDQGQPAEVPAGADPARICPVCQLLAASPFAPPQAIAVAVHSTTSAVARPPATLGLDRLTATGAPRNRGPPAPA